MLLSELVLLTELSNYAKNTNSYNGELVKYTSDIE
ncbi:hypothetical protein SAMN05421676_107174 [Salinibacillus kushneri]|uniref:Uncharacterized protein n=1 Tax=Salinibacillus kushneri TaxID=237682 RepID=A0A1I0GUQ5_9BACI|nr:hypothetical protein SAMN05421676_107174 [Salinibacillus kushneri]